VDTRSDAHTHDLDRRLSVGSHCLLGRLEGQDSVFEREAESGMSASRIPSTNDIDANMGKAHGGREDLRVGVQRLEVYETAADEVDCHGVATWAVLRQQRQLHVITEACQLTLKLPIIVTSLLTKMDELAPTFDKPDTGLHADLRTGALDDEVDRFEPTLPETKLLHDVLALHPVS
jgi:hypothetical protein